MSTNMRKLINLFEARSADKHKSLKRMVGLYNATDSNILTFNEYNQFYDKYISPLEQHQVSFEIDDNYVFIPDGWWEADDIIEITFYIKDIKHYHTKGNYSSLATSPDEYYGDDELEFDPYAYEIANHTEKLVKVNIVKNSTDTALTLYNEKIEENIREEYLKDADDYEYGY